VTDEDEDSFSYSVRISSQDLLMVAFVLIALSSRIIKYAEHENKEMNFTIGFMSRI